MIISQTPSVSSGNFAIFIGSGPFPHLLIVNAVPEFGIGELVGFLCHHNVVLFRENPQYVSNGVVRSVGLHLIIPIVHGIQRMRANMSSLEGAKVVV